MGNEIRGNKFIKEDGDNEYSFRLNKISQTRLKINKCLIAVLALK